MDDEPLRPATRDELLFTLSYGLTHRTSGKPHRAAGDAMATIAAETLIEHLERSGYVVMKKPAPKRHSIP
jgi:hypothetical protein